MSYKPLSQTVTNGKDKEVSSSDAVFDAIAAIPSLPSSVAGDVDKVLAVDAAGAKSWQFAGLGAGSLGTNNVILGRSKPSGLTTGTANILIGASAGNALTTGSHNLILGIDASTLLGVNDVISIGNEANRYNRGDGNVSIGRQAGLGSSSIFSNGRANTVVGSYAGKNITTGNENVLMGYAAGWYTGVGLTTGSKNVGIGIFSLSGNPNTGNHNVAVGHTAGNNLSTGSDDVFVGFEAGKLVTTGNKNIFLGFTAGDAVTTGSNNTIIGDIAGTTALSNTVILAAGTAERMRIDSAGNVGIGTATPTEKLEVAGAVKADEFVVPNYRLDPHTHDEGTETGNFTINWANGAVHSVTLNAAGPLVVTLNNPVNGGAYALRIIQGATPGTVTWPASVKWPGGTPPTLSTTTGDVDIVNFLYYADTGFYYGTFAGDFS